MAITRYSQSKTTLKSNEPIRIASACIVGAGNVSGGYVTEAPSIKTMGVHTGKHGSVVINPETDADIASGDNRWGWTYKPVSAGNFANMQAGRYIIVRYTNYVAGVAYTKLNTGSAGDGGHKSIHHIQKRRTRMITATGGWNYNTGALLSTPNIAHDDFGADHAANVNRAIPGEFTFSKFGLATHGSLAVPYNADYSDLQT